MFSGFGWSAWGCRLIRIGLFRLVSGRQRQVPRLCPPRHRKRVNDAGILLILPLNECPDSAFRIVIVLAGRFLDRLNFLLSRSDIGGDRVLNDPIVVAAVLHHAIASVSCFA